MSPRVEHIDGFLARHKGADGIALGGKVAGNALVTVGVAAAAAEPIGAVWAALRRMIWLVRRAGALLVG